ncbi:phage scaffolding protein [Clostridium intestinale]|uniref:Phage minor structural protein GP20 n=1 Tax=Clostridium intestinale URNW TaxID=1294142 RepID=U2NQZ2_9CLOT|nr:phage scaffolding protein [Clostridium intestinale]ERK31573.1 phage minor structural protein GP20 [Clostridium intestinale URNW]
MTKEQFIALGLTEEQATKASTASQEELKGYVEKTRFDTVSKENNTLKTTVKAHETQLENLKKDSGDNEALKKQIETLQNDNKAAKEKHDLELKELQISNAIKLAIADKAQDADLVAGLFDKSKLLLGDDGKVTGLDEQLKTLKESKAFLFKAETTTTQTEVKPGFKLGVDGNSTQVDPNPKVSMKDAIAAKLQIQK